MYLSYGTSFLENAMSEVTGVGAGVLLRSIEPLDLLRRPRKKRIDLLLTSEG